jgi:hypothetical protein
MMKIEVNKADLNRIFGAIDKVKAIALDMTRRIPEDSAKEFADILRSNIVSQKYGDFGHPRGDSSWKKNLDNSGLYWLWLGTVLKSIKPWNVMSTASMVKWFVGIQYSGGSPSTTSASVAKVTAKGKKVKTGAVIMKKGARTVVPSTVTRLTPQQVRVKNILQEREMSRKAAETGVRHIDPTGYVPQTKASGTQLAGGKTFSFGKERIKKRIRPEEE